MSLKATHAWFLLALAVTSCTTSGRGDERFNLAVTKDNEFRSRQFVEAGLSPIQSVAASGQEVRRMMLRGWVPGPLPAMELERHRDGSVSLTLVQERERQQFAASAAAWDEIAALDKGVFETPKPLPRPPAAAPPLSCHGMSVYFEGATRRKVKSAGAMDCPRALFPFNPARRAALEAFVRLALSARACRREANEAVEWAMSRCFARRG